MKSLSDVLAEIERSRWPIYIYVLHKWDGTPFYVGKGSDRRVTGHEKEAKSNRKWDGMNSFKLNTIRKMWREGESVCYSIDSWHNSGQSANNREVELIAAIGRRVKNEGTLTNITAGGEGVTDLPEETKRKIADKLRKMYQDDPQLAVIMSEKLKKYFDDNPDVVIKLQECKNKWKQENPQVAAEVEEKRLEIARLPETRQQISATLKQYYQDPEAIRANSERITKYFEEHPGAREAARQNAIENDAGGKLVQWMRDNPEGLAERQRKHGKTLKQWYADNPDEAQALAERRNEVLRSEEHRKLMAEKTRAYNQSNPEANRKRREKATESLHKTLDERMDARQRCLRMVHDRLVAAGEIQPRDKEITSKALCRWRKRGLIDKYFPTLPMGNVSAECWQQFFTQAS